MPEERTSLFCERCEPVFPKKSTALALYQPDAHISAKDSAESFGKMEVGDLGEYEGGYVNPATLFRDEFCIRIPAKAEVRKEPERKFTLRIVRSRDLILVDLHTIGDRWFPFKDPPTKNIVSFEVRIVDFDL